MKAGDKVKIYENALTKKHLEGEAILVELI